MSLSCVLFSLILSNGTNSETERFLDNTQNCAGKKYDQLLENHEFPRDGCTVEQMDHSVVINSSVNGGVGLTVGSVTAVAVAVKGWDSGLLLCLLLSC